MFACRHLLLILLPGVPSAVLVSSCARMWVTSSSVLSTQHQLRSCAPPSSLPRFVPRSALVSRSPCCSGAPGLGSVFSEDFCDDLMRSSQQQVVHVENEWCSRFVVCPQASVQHVRDEAALPEDPFQMVLPASQVRFSGHTDFLSSPDHCSFARICVSGCHSGGFAYTTSPSFMCKRWDLC